MSMGSDSAYVSMMVESLKKKRDVLISVLDLSKEQENMLKSSKVDADVFTDLINKKGSYIDELNSLDDGFDGLYKKVEQTLISDRNSYNNEIDAMKSLISEITELSVSIQAAEKKNDDYFKKYVSDERARLRQLNTSQQTAMTYAQNMAGMHRQGDSYFVNEKK